MTVALFQKRLHDAPHGQRRTRQKHLDDAMTAALAAEYAATLARRKPMTVMYVPHADVARYEAMGWTRTDALRGTYHGEFAVLMIEPTCARVTVTRCSVDDAEAALKAWGVA